MERLYEWRPLLLGHANRNFADERYASIFADVNQLFVLRVLHNLRQPNSQRVHLLYMAIER